MTIINDRIEDVGGSGFDRRVTFFIEHIRESSDGDAIVTTVPHHFELDEGELTTTDLDPGPAKVQIGAGSYNITIPESGSPIRLWPLIDAALPTPAVDISGFVHNGGGVARIQALTAAEYSALEAPDPATFFVVIED